MIYDFQKLKDAILFNTIEVLPSGDALDNEITNLINLANSSNEVIKHYIGFEISGQIHIGTGISTALKVKKLQDAGVKCSIYLADYHTYLNNKLDGKMETIRKVSKEYFAPVMKECLRVCGCNIEDIDFIFAEDLYKSGKNNQTFWDFELGISKHLTLNRVLKSVSITGKDSGDGVEFATLRYPVMQVADIFFMQAHIVHAGIDQRKCHVIAREVSESLSDEFALKVADQKIKPIAIHHALLHGLSKPEKKADGKLVSAKMSKSKPDSAIWVHDSEEEIIRKLKASYCPIIESNNTEEQNQELIDNNPILNWIKNAIFISNLSIDLKDREGLLIKSYTQYPELLEDFKNGQIHPLDLKMATARTLIKWFEPIREFIAKNPEGYELVKSSRK
jgi:tyrosyl-tRNA synthetase